MGLVAHYRLDGNADDALGKYNLQEYSNSGHLLPTTDAIMGQAYYRPTVNNSPACFATTQTIHLAGSHTLACWAKVTGVHPGTANGLVSYHSHAHNTGSGITVREISGSDYRISCNTGTGESRTYNTFYGTSNIKDRWCHLVFRFDALENKISLWVDGQKEFETTYALVTRPDIIAVFAWSTTHLGSAMYRPAAYIDDVRIYDHALSEREIRDLSQGLVLHYTYNQFQEPTENLIPNGGFETGLGIPTESGSHGDNQVVQINNPGSSSYVLRQGTGSVEYEIHSSKTLLPNTSYTMSCLVAYTPDWNGSTQIFHARWYNSDGTNNALSGIGSALETYSFGGLVWTKRYLTFTTGSTASGAYNWYLGYSGGATAGYRYVTNIQLEQKPYATPFVNGIRTGTVRDSSSQGNDASLALTTTPKWVEDSVLGKGCYTLELGKYFSLPKSTLGKLSSCTISFWRKRTAAGSWIVGNGGNPSGGVYFMATSGGTGAFYHASGSVGSPVIYRDGVLSTTPANDDGWHHYCLVGADLSTWTYLNINAYDTTSGTWVFRGLIDDLRIYATALSADEVMELYQQRASIDSQGNLVC